ncbi:MAG: hypothetical protein MZV65_27965 [Chromatiales bacterium]|nr:hypothetical protein [Chromatiales bacterium]
MVIALGIGWATSLALSIPELSVNLREVFWRGGNLLNLLCFGLFIEGLGTGAGLLGLALRRVQLPWLLLPLLALPVCLVAYLCLYLQYHARDPARLPRKPYRGTAATQP